jgi:hypothetical protein
VQAVIFPRTGIFGVPTAVAKVSTTTTGRKRQQKLKLTSRKGRGKPPSIESKHEPRTAQIKKHSEGQQALQNDAQVQGSDSKVGEVNSSVYINPTPTPTHAKSNTGIYRDTSERQVHITRRSAHPPEVAF